MSLFEKLNNPFLRKKHVVNDFWTYDKCAKDLEDSYNKKMAELDKLEEEFMKVGSGGYHYNQGVTILGGGGTVGGGGGGGTVGGSWSDERGYQWVDEAYNPNNYTYYDKNGTEIGTIKDRNDNIPGWGSFFNPPCNPVTPNTPESPPRDAEIVALEEKIAVMEDTQLDIVLALGLSASATPEDILKAIDALKG